MDGLKGEISLIKIIVWGVWGLQDEDKNYNVSTELKPTITGRQLSN